MRTLVIGDIHGCLRALDCLLADVGVRDDDLLITLGDYVDRGPDSKGVLDRLLALRNRCQLVALKGNHDLMMLAARADLEHYNDWLASGGKNTLQSYGADIDWQALAQAIPAEHWRFLEEECESFYETDRHYFVHANAYPDMPLGDQPDYMLFWEKLEVGRWRPHESGKVMVCGHTVQRSGRPMVLQRAVCIDTWVYGEGWLTCLDVEREVYRQANQRGETRMGNLQFRSR
jgi:serine/threonine protein phosphatase 1